LFLELEREVAGVRGLLATKEGGPHGNEGILAIFPMNHPFSNR